jgi:hypothetical protein
MGSLRFSAEASVGIALAAAAAVAEDLRNERREE